MIIMTLRPEDRIMARAFVVLMAIGSMAVLLVYYNMFKYSPSGVVKIKHTAEENKTENRNKASLLLEYTDRSVADSLASKVRVLCWVLTNPRNWRRLANVQDTWGQRCNVLLFFTTARRNKTTKNKPKMIALPEVEGEEDRGAKIRAVFRYLHQHHRREADWFLRANDTTYVIVENLRYMLAHHASNSSISFGFTYTSRNRGYMSGGADVGYVLSRGALDRLVERGLSGDTLCRGCDLGRGIDMVKCLRRVGVTAGNSRSLRRGNFFPTRGQGGPLPNQSRRYWCWSYMYYPTGDGYSKYVISFYDIEPIDMHVLDFLIYHLHPYGIEDNTGKEPIILNSMKTTNTNTDLSDNKFSNANTDLSVKSKKAKTDRSHTSKNVTTTKQNTDQSQTSQNVKTTKENTDQSHLSKNAKTTKEKTNQSHMPKNVKTTKENTDQSNTSKNVKTTKENISQSYMSKHVKTTKEKTDQSHTSKHVKTTKAKTDQIHTSKHVKTTKEKTDQSHTSKHVKTTKAKTDQIHTSKHVKTTKAKTDPKK